MTGPKVIWETSLPNGKTKPIPIRLTAQPTTTEEDEWEWYMTLEINLCTDSLGTPVWTEFNQEIKAHRVFYTRLLDALLTNIVNGEVGTAKDHAKHQGLKASWEEKEEEKEKKQ